MVSPNNDDDSFDLEERYWTIAYKRLDLRKLFLFTYSIVSLRMIRQTAICNLQRKTCSCRVAWRKLLKYFVERRVLVDQSKQKAVSTSTL